MQQLEQILDVPIGYFTEREIVRLYNTLSDEGKDQALNYVKKLVQKEQYKNVISIAEKLYEYHVYEKMSAGISSASIAKLGKGDNITTDVLIKICEEMNCHLKDIMESIDEREKNND